MRSGVPSCKSGPLEGLLVAPPIKRRISHLLSELKTYKWLVRRGRQMREINLLSRLYVLSNAFAISGIRSDDLPSRPNASARRARIRAPK